MGGLLAVKKSRGARHQMGSFSVDVLIGLLALMFRRVRMPLLPIMTTMVVVLTMVGVGWRTCTTRTNHRLTALMMRTTAGAMGGSTPAKHATQMNSHSRKSTNPTWMQPRLSMTSCVMDHLSHQAVRNLQWFLMNDIFIHSQSSY